MGKPLPGQTGERVARTGFACNISFSSRKWSLPGGTNGQRLMWTNANAQRAHQAGIHIVHCVKFGKRQCRGYWVRPPWKGELGKRVFENVSKDAWKLWLEYSKMVMNEYRLNPLDPNSQKIMEEQMEQFFFGEGAKLPEGYVPPKAKG